MKKIALLLVVLILPMLLTIPVNAQKTIIGRQEFRIDTRQVRASGYGRLIYEIDGRKLTFLLIPEQPSKIKMVKAEGYSGTPYGEPFYRPYYHYCEITIIIEGKPLTYDLSYWSCITFMPNKYLEILVG